MNTLRSELSAYSGLDGNTIKRMASERVRRLENDAGDQSKMVDAMNAVRSWSKNEIGRGIARCSRVLETLHADAKKWGHTFDEKERELVTAHLTNARMVADPFNAGGVVMEKFDVGARISTTAINEATTVTALLDAIKVTRALADGEVIDVSNVSRDMLTGTCSFVDELSGVLDTEIADVTALHKELDALITALLDVSTRVTPTRAFIRVEPALNPSIRLHIGDDVADAINQFTDGSTALSSDTTVRDVTAAISTMASWITPDD